MLKQFLARKQRRRNFSRSLMTVPALENISVFFSLITLIKDFYRHLFYGQQASSNKLLIKSRS